MFGIIIGLGFVGMLVFIFVYPLCLTLRRLSQAVVLPPEIIAFGIAIVFVLGALSIVLSPPEARVIFARP